MTRTDPLRVVVVGDSLTVPIPGCVAGAPRRVAPCVSLEQALARDLGELTGRPVVTVNLSLPGGDVDGVLLGLTSDERERIIGEADLVVVSVGMQSQGGVLAFPCGVTAWTGDHDDSGLEVLAQLSDACLYAFVSSYRSRLGQIYASIESLVSDHPAVLVDLGVFNGLVGHPDLEALPPSSWLGPALERSLELTGRWATADCAAATAHGFVCADLWHAVNGSSGREPASDYSSWLDGSPRLTQAGVAMVARLVESLDLSPLL
ncbi:MAG: hypothetical protein ABIS35_06680 [Terracoccus sp.]